MKQLILCIICLGLGWIAGSRYTTHVNEAPQNSVQEEQQDQMTAKHQELVQDLKNQLSNKEALTDMLNKELAETRDSLATKLAPPEPEESTPAEAASPFMANIQTMAVDMVQVQNQEELEKLKRTLNLTPEQLEVLEAFYQKEADQQSRMMQQVFSGKPMEDMHEELMSDMTMNEYFSVSDVMKDILTPEQMVTYEANEEKEALERKEAMAYSELSQIQRQFVLDDEQKDAAFAIFYEAEYKLDSEDYESLEVDGDDPDFGIRYQELQNERLLEALSDVLTEEQLASQRKKLDAELEMQRKAMSMFGEGFMVSPSAE